MPIFELSYHGEVAGFLDCASTFEPIDEDAVFLNAAQLRKFGA